MTNRNNKKSKSDIGRICCKSD